MQLVDMVVVVVVVMDVGVDVVVVVVVVVEANVEADMELPWMIPRMRVFKTPTQMNLWLLDRVTIASAIAKMWMVWESQTTWRCHWIFLLMYLVV
jgi:hypothetical protein